MTEPMNSEDQAVEKAVIVSSHETSQEPDTCRICSGPEEPGMPLYHPCKCSGTIRYVHQECLKSWLDTSKRTKCDVCKHTYAFTKVYSPNMPETIPFELVADRVLRQTFNAAIMGIRFMYVSVIWLGVLPFLLAWSWKSIFYMVDTSAWAIFGNDVPIVKPTFFNSTTVIPDNQKSWAEPLMRALTSNPKRTNEWVIRLTENMAADIFLGQIVACVVVVTFVCLFFLREWVVQNAHPGVLEDAPQGADDDGGANAAAVDLDGVVDAQQQELLLAEILRRKNEEIQQVEPEPQTLPTALVEPLEGAEDVVKDDRQAEEPEIAVQTTSPQVENQIRDDGAVPPDSIHLTPLSRRKTKPPTADINSWATAISSQTTFPLPDGTVINPSLSPPPSAAGPSSLSLNFDYAQPPFNRAGPLDPASKPQLFPPWVATSDTLTQRESGGKRTTFKIPKPKPRVRDPEPTTPPPTTAELATTAKPDVVPPTWLAPNDQWKSIFDKIATQKTTVKSDTFLATSPSATSKRFPEQTRAFDVPAAGPSTSAPIEVAEEPFQLAPPINPATLDKISPPFRFGSPTSSTAPFTFGFDARKPHSDPLMEVLNEMTQGIPPVNKVDRKPSLSVSARRSADGSPSRRMTPPSPQANPLTDAVTGAEKPSSPLGFTRYANPSFDSIARNHPNPYNIGHTKKLSTSSTASSTFFDTPSTPHGATNPRSLPTPSVSSNGFSLYAQQTDALLSFQSMQSLVAIDPPWSTLGKDKSNPIVIRPSPELGPTRLPRDPSPPAKELDISAFQFPRPAGLLLDVPSSTNTEAESTSSSTNNTPLVPARGLTKTPPSSELEAKKSSNTPPAPLTERRNQHIGPLSIPPPMQSTRRPGLPSSAGQDVIEEIQCLASSLNGTPTRPLPSPSIALYRPPEDVLTSPSSAARLPPEGTEELDLYFPLAPVKDLPVDGDTVYNHDALVPAPLKHANGPINLAPVVHEREAALDGMAELAHQARLVVQQEDEFAPHEAVLDLEDEQAEEADAVEPVEAGNAPQAGNQLLDPPLVMDDEPFGDDEMVNALEAIGVRGPVHVIFQNAGLVILVLDLALLIGVFVPYYAGKHIALLLIHPGWVKQAGQSRFTSVLAFVVNPFKVIRSIFRFAVASYAAFTVPLDTFDSNVAEMLELFDKRLAWAPSIFSALADPFSSGYEAANTSLSPLLQRVWYYAPPSLINSVDMAVKAWRLVIPIDGTARASSAMSSVDASARQVMQLVATDPSYAIAFGWSIILLGIFVYSKATRLRGAALILKLVKVAALILIETAIRPLIIGALVDAMTLPLFQGATVDSRIAGWFAAPFTRVFQYWLVGNIILIQFIQALDDIRRFVRPGALMKVHLMLDPVGRSLREMINKSLGWHLKIYLINAIAGFASMWLFVGLILDLTILGTLNFAPLKWHLRAPMTPIPIDLIIFHIFLPATFSVLRLRRIGRQGIKSFWMDVSKLCRLSSFMLGKRAPEEEKGVPFWKKAEEGPPLNGLPIDGRYYRVPATEHTLVLEGQPEYIETDADGVAMNEPDRTLVELQMAAARKFGRDPTADYKVIFYPSHFKLRLVAFFACLWSASAAVIWVAGVLPIRIGRLALARAFGLRDAHDAYSWLVGLYALWAVQMARYIVSRERRRWKKYLSTRKRRRFPVKLFFYHTTGMFARLIVAAISIFGVLPLLLGLVFEVYLVIPLKYAVRPGVPAAIRFWDCWATGMLWGSILTQAQRYAPPNVISRTFDTLKRDGWFRIRLRQLMHEFILPLCAGLLLLAILPFFLQWAIFTPLTGNDSFMLTEVYPLLVAALLVGVITEAGRNMLEAWIQRVRDREFLVDTRVRNLEEAEAQAEAIAQPDAQPPVEA